MKILCVFMAFLTLVFGFEGTVILPKNMDHKELAHYKTWTKDFNMSANHPHHLRNQKMENFKHNLKRIQNHNQLTWKMGLNKFSEMSFEEFSRTYLMVAQNCSATRGNHVMSGNVSPPEHKDWRREGKYVTKVKNQGKCGSCWTFSTTGCLESTTAIHVAGNPLISLSEQQLVDCAQNFNNKGCGGGLPSQAYEYIKYNNGLMKEADYPYQAKNGVCKFEAAKASAHVKSVVNITMDAENELVDAVAFKNPVSIAFQVTEDFQHYKSGVYSSTKCGNSPAQVNHAVLAVGFGTDESGMKYWIVKNSWGSDWGMDGYFMIERGVNMCGLATCASYPIV